MIRDRITPSLQRIQRELGTVPREAYQYWLSQTPVRSGHARRSTRLVQQEIQARYAYAQRLDQGWSSQAPDGMSQPTQQWLERRWNTLVRK